MFATSNTLKGKLSFISVGSKFKAQLGELMEKLRNNVSYFELYNYFISLCKYTYLQGTNFIRCVKPNNKMIDQQFDGSLSLMQLKCSGMTIVLELMQHGYPTRAPFGDLYNTYQEYLPKKLQQLSPRSFCEVI